MTTKGLASAARQGQGSATKEEMSSNEDDRSPLAPDEELDSDIAFGLLGSLIYSEQGTQQMLNVLGAQNPAPAMGNFLASAIDRTNKKLGSKGMDLSPNIWLAEGGVVDRLLDEVAELANKAGVKFDAALQSQAFAEVIDQLKLAGQAESRSGGAGQQPPGPLAPEQQEAGPPGPPPVDPMAGGGTPPPAPMMGGM
jgi:hypothetical protein